MSALTLVEPLPVSSGEVVKVPLNGVKGAGKFALIDAEDYDKVMAFSTAWSIGGGRYAKG